MESIPVEARKSIVEDEIFAIIDMLCNATSNQGPNMRWILNAAIEGIDESMLVLCDEEVQKRYAASKNLLRLLIRGKYDMLSKFSESRIDEFAEGDVDGYLI